MLFMTVNVMTVNVVTEHDYAGHYNAMNYRLYLNRITLVFIFNKISRV